MKVYKLSANTKEEIIEFLNDVFQYNWNGTQTPITIDKTTFTYIDKIINTYDLDENNLPINITYLDGYHFDLLSDKDIFFIEQKDENNNVIPIIFYPNIIQHKPKNPKHLFS